MKLYRGLALAAASLALLVPSGARAADDAVRVGVAAISPTYALYYATKELGFYKDVNLDVSITQFRGGPAAQEALAAGAIDVCAVVPLEVSLAVQKGVKERIVALFGPPKLPGWYIMVPADSPIKSMAQLDGKTVGVTQPGSQTDLWVQRAAKASGITVKTVALGAGVDAGLRAKQVDAAILWPMFSYKGLVHADLRPIFDFSSLPSTISEGVAVSSDLIDKRPDVVRRFLTATAKAIAYMRGHQEWSVAFLKRYFDDNDDQAVRMAYTNFILKINPDGAMQPAWMKDALSLGAAAAVGGATATNDVFAPGFTPIKVR